MIITRVTGSTAWDGAPQDESARSATVEAA